jgi:hypothetical protein
MVMTPDVIIRRYPLDAARWRPHHSETVVQLAMTMPQTEREAYAAMLEQQASEWRPLAALTLSYNVPVSAARIRQDLSSLHTHRPGTLRQPLLQTPTARAVAVLGDHRIDVVRESQDRADAPACSRRMESSTAVRHQRP